MNLFFWVEVELLELRELLVEVDGGRARSLTTIGSWFIGRGLTSTRWRDLGALEAMGSGLLRWGLTSRR